MVTKLIMPTIKTDDENESINITLLCEQAKNNKIAAARKKAKKKQQATQWRPYMNRKGSLCHTSGTPVELTNGWNHICEKCGKRLTKCLCIE